MDGFLLVIVLSYILFNLAFGVLIMLPYYLYKEEEEIVERKEFFLILLLPVVGLGNYRFNRDNRDDKKDMLPQPWYVATNMVKVNLPYLFVLFLIVLHILGISGDTMIDGAKVDDTEISGAYVNFIAGIGAGFVWIALAFFMLVIYSAFALALIFIPMAVANSIKSKHLNHLLNLKRRDENRRKEQVKEERNFDNLN